MLDVNSLEEIKDHIRNRSYMSGVDREYARVKSTGEVFTPTNTVHHILSKISINFFQEQQHPVLDPTCGDGQFLGEVLIRKIENGSTFEQALSTIYGVDLMIDNVDLCRERLLCGREDLRHIVEKNIVCYNGLEYDYEFARRKKIEIKYETSERKKSERARKKAEKEKIKLEKIKKDAREVISRALIYKTGKPPTENMIEKELKKLKLD